MNLKNEKGSITVYVLVAMFFLVAIVVGRFVIANRNLKVQYDALSKIKTVYENNDKIYEKDDGTGGGGGGEILPSEPKTHEVYIFNKDAYEFFRGKGSTSNGRFYVYQVGIYYIYDESKRQSPNDVLIKDNDDYVFKYKLMSDITLSDNRNTIAQDEFVKNLDFNNHLIFAENSTTRYVYSTERGPVAGMTNR